MKLFKKILLATDTPIDEHPITAKAVGTLDEPRTSTFYEAKVIRKGGR